MNFIILASIVSSFYFLTLIQFRVTRSLETIPAAVWQKSAVKSGHVASLLQDKGRPITIHTNIHTYHQFRITSSSNGFTELGLWEEA